MQYLHFTLQNQNTVTEITHLSSAHSVSAAIDQDPDVVAGWAQRAADPHSNATHPTSPCDCKHTQ